MAVPNGDMARRIALQRFGLGARPVQDPGLSDDPVGTLRAEIAARRLAPMDAGDLPSTADALQQLDEFRIAKRRMAMAGPAAEDRMPAMAGPPAPPPPYRLFREEADAHFRTGVEARTGFGERLAWFWANHFAVSVAKSQPVRVAAGPMVREAIRPHVFGRFADMLLAVESHPAMLFYLDNRLSIGPDSRVGERRGKGLNENLAREILELHTLGADSGYTQADVTSFAKVLTGWTVIGPADEDGDLGTFAFNPNRHEPGPQVILGKRYAQAGLAQGKAVLADLARHPATATHLASKLVRHFIADQPPPGLVKELAQVYRDSDGDLAAVCDALVTAPEAFSAQMRKIRLPQEFVVAAQRATGIRFNPGLLLGACNTLGQPLWQPGGPNGFDDGSAAWATPEGLKARLDVAALFARQVPAQVNPLQLASTLYGDALGPDTRQAISRAESKPQGLALLLMSPEFQRR